MKYYIAYGSNLNTRQMAYRCPTAQKFAKGELKDYKMEFRGEKENAVATITPEKDSKIPVLVWIIEKSDEKALDIYEGFPRFYRKENMEIEINGKTENAMVYIMNEGHEIGMPSETYLDTILKGYEEAGFNTETVDKALLLSESNCEQANSMDLNL